MSVKQTLTTLMMTLACLAVGNLAHAADMPAAGASSTTVGEPLPRQ